MLQCNLTKSVKINLFRPKCRLGFCAKLGIAVSPHVRESMGVLDSGFHAVDSGFRVLDSGFQLSGIRIPKRAGFQFFTALSNTFLCISFSCSNLTILKDVVRMHNKFVFFFDL